MCRLLLWNYDVEIRNTHFTCSSKSHKTHEHPVARWLWPHLGCFGETGQMIYMTPGQMVQSLEQMLTTRTVFRPAAARCDTEASGLCGTHLTIIPHLTPAAPPTMLLRWGCSSSKALPWVMCCAVTHTSCKPAFLCPVQTIECDGM